MHKIGIVGLGIMGSGMATNFLQKGHQVFMWNRTVSKTNSLIDQGALLYQTPAELARAADLIFEVTANDESSRQVWSGKEGILAGADASKTLIASATLSVAWVDELAALCKAKGLEFMDIALTGGRVGAETGNLTLLVGGQGSSLEKISATLQAIAGKVLHFGPVGHGMRYKLILNFLQALHAVGFGQAMQIAKAQQMDLKKVAEALADRPGGVITDIAQKAYFTKPDPTTFSIEWITKDLNYAKQFAQGLDVNLLNQVLEQYQQALTAGFGSEDWASINTI